MSDYNTVNFPGLESVVMEVGQTHTKMEEGVAFLMTEVDKYKAHWQGDARVRWDDVQIFFAKEMEVVRQQVIQLGQMLGRSHEEMLMTERANVGLFSA